MWFFKKKAPPPGEKIELKITGMSCENCTAAVRRTLTLPGIAAVKVNLRAGTATFYRADTAPSVDAIRQLITAQGYEVAPATA